MQTIISGTSRERVIRTLLLMVLIGLYPAPILNLINGSVVAILKIMG